MIPSPGAAPDWPVRRRGCVPGLLFKLEGNDMPTKAEYQQQNDELRNKLAAYEALGSPEFIKEKLDVANEAINATTAIKKLLA